MFVEMAVVRGPPQRLEMTEIARFLTVMASALILIAAPSQARETENVTIVVTEWTEFAPVVRFDPVADMPVAIDSFGPFRVIDGHQAALVDVTDEASPAQFRAMLSKYPALHTLQLVEAPGTLDDLANLELGRMIRSAGLQTHVPAYGSVRSGAVELVFAGTQWRIDEGAEFAVHAWMDDIGQSAGDYPADAPEHRKYLAYYREMGLDGDEAAAFYAMTNATPFEQARWLNAQEMRGWLGLDEVVAEVPQIAYAAL